MKKIALALLVLACRPAVAQKYENLAMTPPMGWNSWNTFQVNINEKMVEDMADAMVSSGMRDAGYTYIILDDGWMAKERDSLGNLVPDPQKFPHGIKALADYIHSKGLKFGLYNCAGTNTCAGYPGTRGYEYQDARNYAAWTIDYLKFDWCYTDGINPKEAYTTMAKALKAAGRPIVFSLCEWGNSQPWKWAEPVGELWRTTGDISPCFDCNVDHKTWYSHGIMRNADQEVDLAPYAGPGHWNDPDMLEVGNGMSESEDRAHFSLWCILAAPLIAGNDLRKMTPETVAILTKKAVIAVDQDPLGAQGLLYSVKDSVQTWVKPLADGDWAVCFLNRSLTPMKVDFDWKQEHVVDSIVVRNLDARAHQYGITDLWTGKNLGTTEKPFSGEVQPHDVVLLRLH